MITRKLTILFISVILNGCQSSQTQTSELADYRATIISSKLPKKMGPITLVQAKANENTVTLIFTKQNNIDMDSLVKRVANVFCNEIETKYLLSSGISYRIIALGQNKKVESFSLISIKACLH
nr:type II secretion system pilot lipoprotein GspS-beta [Vibrio tapetis]